MDLAVIGITESDLELSDQDDTTPVEDRVDREPQGYADKCANDQPDNTWQTAVEINNPIETLSEITASDMDEDDIFISPTKDKDLKPSHQNIVPENGQHSNRLPEFSSVYYATPSLRDVLRNKLDAQTYKAVVDTSTLKLCTKEVYEHLLDDVCVGVLNTEMLRRLLWDPSSVLVSVLGGFATDKNSLSYISMLDCLIADWLSSIQVTGNLGIVNDNVLMYNVTKNHSNMALTLLRQPEWIELGNRLLNIPESPSFLIYQILSNHEMFEVLPNGNILQLCGTFVANRLTNSKASYFKSSNERTSKELDILEDVTFLKYVSCRDAKLTDQKYTLNVSNGESELTSTCHTERANQTLPRDLHADFVFKNLFPLEYGLPLFKVTSKPGKSNVQNFKDPGVIATTKTIDQELADGLKNVFYPIFLEIQRRHAQTNYALVIDRVCSQHLLTDLKYNVTSKDLHCDVHIVSKALVLLFEKVFPKDIFGSEPESNWKSMTGVIKQIVYLGRNEKIRLSYILGQLDIPRITWASNICSSSEVSSRLVGQFIAWLVRFWILKVLNTFFVSKAVGSDINTQLYYRRYVWNKVEESVLKNGNFTKVDRRFVAPTLKMSTLGSGTAFVRPKPDKGYRPIVSLGGQKGKTPTVNDQLSDLFDVLKFVTQADRARMTSVVKNVHSFLPAIDAFKAARPKSQYYMAKVDISKCFDMLNRDAVLSIAQKFLSRFDNYEICETIATDIKAVEKGIWSRKTFKRVTPLDQTLRNHQLFNAEMLKHGIPEKTRLVFIDSKKAHWTISKDRALQLLDEHLKNTVVKNSRRYFTIKDGVPQGSVLSSLLCTLTLNQFETDVLHYDRSTSALFRYVDDFLFLSTQKEHTIEFMKAMTSGSTDYGVSINPEKSIINFETDQVEPRPIFANDYIPFLQWDIHVKTLDPMIRASDPRISFGATGLAKDTPPDLLLSHIKLKLLHKITSTLTKFLVEFKWRSKKAFLRSIRLLAADLRIRIRTMAKAANQNCLSYREHTRQPCLALVLKRTSNINIASSHEIRSAFLCGFK